MNIKPIKTDEDYHVALKRLERIFDAKAGTLSSDEADILGLMIDEYEKKQYPIESPDPRNLTARLNLSPGLLISDYKLTGQ